MKDAKVFHITHIFYRPHKKNSWLASSPTHKKGHAQDFLFFLFYSNNFKDAVRSVCKQRLCLHFGIQNIEFYSIIIYIFMILEYNKLSRHNNQALQEHKIK